MRYRKLDSAGDFVVGARDATFLADSAETVAQAVATRLRQLEGEWPLDTTDGTPYATEILGAGKSATADLAVQRRIMETPGVASIDKYSSSTTNRKLEIRAIISTLYGQTEIEVLL